MTAQDILGIWLYDYNDCKIIPGAKGKIDVAYHDPWIMANTVGSRQLSIGTARPHLDTSVPQH